MYLKTDKISKNGKKWGKYPNYGQLCAGFRIANTYHHNQHKITFHLIPNLAYHLILRTKTPFRKLGLQSTSWYAKLEQI